MTMPRFAAIGVLLAAGVTIAGCAPASAEEQARQIADEALRTAGKLQENCDGGNYRVPDTWTEPEFREVVVTDLATEGETQYGVLYDVTDTELGDVTGEVYVLAVDGEPGCVISASYSR